MRKIKGLHTRVKGVFTAVPVAPEKSNCPTLFNQSVGQSNLKSVALALVVIAIHSSAITADKKHINGSLFRKGRARK